MDATVIPFARRKSDKALVDTTEVPGGKACGCICPSCRSPLIARKGTQKVWHFAHTARADGDRTEELCEFSWAVSVRLMARQLLPSLGALCLRVAVFPLFTDGLVRLQPEPTVTLAGPEVLRLERVVLFRVAIGGRRYLTRPRIGIAEALSPLRIRSFVT